MASIVKRITASGEARYDVRWRVNGRIATETRRAEQEAKNLQKEKAGQEAKGRGADPRAGRQKFKVFAERWIDIRLVKGRHFHPRPAMGPEGSCAATRSLTSRSPSSVRSRPRRSGPGTRRSLWLPAGTRRPRAIDSSAPSSTRPRMKTPTSATLVV
jgi:hypothetical protein